MLIVIDEIADILCVLFLDISVFFKMLVIL